MDRNKGEKLVRIRIISHLGDKISIKLPIEFVKKMVKNNSLDLFNNIDDMVDSNKLLNLLTKAFDYNLVGEVAYIERNNGDTIRIIID